MGPFVLAWRLAAHDLRHRLTQSALLLLVIAAATSTLALAFAVDGTSSSPWSTTRAATAGPDVMAEAYPAKHPALDELTALTRAPGVVATSGPYPMASPVLRTGKIADPVFAERSGCHVVAVDLTEEYCAAARWLNQLAGLDDRITVRQGDVTDLPFEDAAFALMFSQHVQMNVAGKALLYGEARRVLAGGGQLAVWDIVAGEGGEPGFPVPWADRPEYSDLTTPDRLRTAIETSGFEIEQWNDLTGQAAATMQTLLTLPPSPIGLQAFVPDFESKAKNLTAALADGRLRAVQGVARAV